MPSVEFNVGMTCEGKSEAMQAYRTHTLVMLVLWWHGLDGIVIISIGCGDGPLLRSTHGPHPYLSVYALLSSQYITITHTIGCANAVKRILGKLEGECSYIHMRWSRMHLSGVTGSCVHLSLWRMYVCRHIYQRHTGVSSIDANVEEKKVVVESTGATSAEDMLAALKKWGEASGKTVALVSSSWRGWMMRRGEGHRSV